MPVGVPQRRGGFTTICTKLATLPYKLVRMGLRPPLRVTLWRSNLNLFFYILGTMQNLISHFLLKNTVCLRVSESEMYQLFLHSSLGSLRALLRS